MRKINLNFQYTSQGVMMAIGILCVLFFSHSAHASNLVRNDLVKSVEPIVHFNFSGNGLNAVSSFKGDVVGCQIMLSWDTSSEIGNDYFEIERSADGQRFIRIGSVQGAGNSISPQKYQYSDDRIFKENYYYRLKLVDFNGDHRFSDIIHVTTACERGGISIDNISTNPNANNWINVQLYTEQDMNDATIVIKDNAERAVKKVTAEIKPGMNIVPLNSEGLEKGTYQIQILQANETFISMTFTKEN